MINANEISHDIRLDILESFIYVSDIYIRFQYEFKNVIFAHRNNNIVTTLS